MRFQVACIKCVKLKVGPEKWASGKFTVFEDRSSRTRFWVEFAGEGLLRMTCPKGHESLTILDYMHFELLLEFAMLAFIDGYCREAVGTAAVALERFYEFYIRVVGAQKGLSQEAFDSFWKSVGGNSERQFGAMTFLHALEGSKVKLPGQGWRERRNNVVHKGEFPTRERTHAFLDETRTAIVELGRELRERCTDGIERVRQHALRDSREVAADADGYTVVGAQGDVERTTLDEELKQLKHDRRSRWRA
jgi:hypothetical protein